MIRISAIGLFLVFAVMPAKDVGDPKQASSGLPMTVRLYNYAEVDESVMRRARQESDRIFTQIGIQTDWLDCPTSPELMVTNRACAAKLGPDNLTLNLLPRSMSKKYGFKRGIFGFALPTAKGLPGQSIRLFVERVLDLAYYGGVGTSFEDAQAIILGHMILHEVGHLLLGPNSHSPSGVMGFPWDKRTLTNVERGRLKFSTGESSKIRKELQRRLDLIADSQTESIHPTE